MCTCTASHKLITLILQLLWLGLWRHWLKLINVMGKLLWMSASVSQHLTYSLQTTDSQLQWAARVCHHVKLWSRSTYSIATACSPRYWPHIHMTVLPQQLLPYINVVATHTTIQSSTLLLSVTCVTRCCSDAYQRIFPPWNACVSLLVARLWNNCHVK